MAIYKQMNYKHKNFISISHITLFVALAVMCIPNISNAAVVSRGSSASSRQPVSTRSNMTSRMPSVSVNTNTDTGATADTVSESDTPSETTESTTSTDDFIIENKSSQFAEVLSDSSTSATDTSSKTLAELVAAQRAELDAQSAITTANATLTGNQNACDLGLRACMREKCGDDFTECRGDTDTMWGNKMDGCRNDLDVTCTGEEYRLFASEIKSDRDMNARLASYNAVLDCGNQYNNCIVTECGTTFGGCLGKSAGDAAIAKCKKIANNCIQQDSGLASRAMQVFANLRVDAEEQVQRDEERLYELRDEMRTQCQSLGATFDERTFSCVFTVEFYAGEDTTLYASKKVYAGDVFDCTPNWFGIDVTTFMENAYRLTRSQTSASSALLGSGLGIAAGAITSGAIDRAIDRHKADKALKEAEKEHEENYGDKSDDAEQDKSDDASDTETPETKSDDTESSASSRPNEDARKAECEKMGGTWKNGLCSNPDCGEGQIWDDFNGRCKERDPETTPLLISEQEQRCKVVGSWLNGKCICNNGGTFNTVTGLCECGDGQKLQDGKCVLDFKVDLTSGLSGNNTGGGLLSGTNSGLGGGLFNTNTTGNTLGTRTVSSRGVSSR